MVLTIDWLLDADSSIRWQVMRDLTDTPAATIAAERSRVSSEGWGARLLDQQRSDGQWGDGAATPFWWSNMYTLLFLRDLGLDPESDRARTAIERVREHVTWGLEFGNSPFFEGEVEPCINGRVVALGAYFGERSDRLVDRLLREQLADGGWNCEAERGSVRSSFHTTICVLEGLLAFEQAFGAAPAISVARARAQEYLLERRLLRRLSTGEIIDRTWTQFAFPALWHYDVLRALDYLRSTGAPPDPRLAEAIAIVQERRQDDGRWLLDVRHKDTLHEDLAGPVGMPSRWITLRALRVLDWHRQWSQLEHAKPRVTSFAPQFLVDDLERSMAYYRKLGFTFAEPWDGFYAIGKLDGLELHLKEAPKPQAERQYRRDNEHLDAAAGVDGIDAFYQHCVASGVTIIKSLASTPWGTKDFYIEDPDGYIISFGGRP